MLEKQVRWLVLDTLRKAYPDGMSVMWIESVLLAWRIFISRKELYEKGGILCHKANSLRRALRYFFALLYQSEKKGTEQIAMICSMYSMLEVRTDAVRRILRQRSIQVGTAPVKIDFLSETRACVIQPDGVVYMGGAGVNITNGIKLETGDILVISVVPSVKLELYLVASSNTTVRVLEVV